VIDLLGVDVGVLADSPETRGDLAAQGLVAPSEIVGRGLVVGDRLGRQDENAWTMPGRFSLRKAVSMR